MPPSDPETLVSACAGVSSDKKIACETLANIADNDGKNRNQEQHHDGEDDDHDHQPEIPPDFPPESFWLSKDAEFDWFERYAFVERKDSQKGNSHPHAGDLNPTPSSISQRFSSAALKVKASVIGLPKPQQKFDPMFKRNCKPSTTANWFPKRTSSVGKSDAPFCEPSSPKVSCIGRIRVRSKRDRWRLKKGLSSISETGSLRSKPDRKQKAGLFSMILRSKKGSDGNSKKTRKESSGRKSGVININYTPDIKERLPDALPGRVEHSPPRKSVGSEPRRSVDSGGGEPSSFGRLNRFTSFRRSDSWVADAQVEHSPPRKSVGNEPRRSVDSSGGEPSGFGGLSRFTSFRKSDSWVSDARVEHSPPRKSVGSEPRRSVDGGGEPSGFGGLNRFTSFRRSDSWISDVAKTKFGCDN